MVPSLSNGSRRWNSPYLLLLILVLGVLSLSCITSEMVLQVEPKDADTAVVRMTVSQYLTEEYVAAAKLANAELQQDYLAAGREAPEKAVWRNLARVQRGWGMARSAERRPDCRAE